MMVSFYRRSIFTVALVWVGWLVAVTQGFVAVPSSVEKNHAATVVKTSRSSRTSKSKLHVVDQTGFDSFKNTINIPEGEESRQYRRTVYSHADWVKHRSPTRFTKYLFAIFKSGVYKNMGREISATVLVATFIWLYNLIPGGYTDLLGVSHPALITSPFVPLLSLPLTPFTLAAPSLGLLLVFRTNTSYKRWDEARKNWGMNINHTRDLVRMANTYYDTTGVTEEQRKDDLNHLALCTWAFVRSMKRHLSPEGEDEEAFQVELYEKLPAQQAQMIIDAAHRPNRALQDLSFAIDDLPMHFVRKNEIHRAVTIFEDDLGSSERLLTSPVPVFYTRHTARFVYSWLLFLPFALYEPFKGSWNHIGMIPATAVLSVFLFGIEELATQLEEPFTILPMQAFCDKIYNWCMEIVSWEAGDNGRDMKPIKPEHSYFAGVSPPSGSGVNGVSSLYTAAPPPVNGGQPAFSYGGGQPNGAAQPNGASPQTVKVTAQEKFEENLASQNQSFEDFLKSQGQGKS